MLCHDSLENYYRLNFSLMTHYKYSLTELDNMMPWERELYIELLKDYIEREKQRQEQEQNQ